MKFESQILSFTQNVRRIRILIRRSPNTFEQQQIRNMLVFVCCFNFQCKTKYLRSVFFFFFYEIRKDKVLEIFHILLNLVFWEKG